MQEVSGLKKTKEELKQEGWRYKHQRFAGCMIFGRNGSKERLLWNEKTQMVTHKFQVR